MAVSAIADVAQILDAYFLDFLQNMGSFPLLGY
jgi:hypothetical protein